MAAMPKAPHVERRPDRTPTTTLHHLVFLPTQAQDQCVLSLFKGVSMDLNAKTAAVILGIVFLAVGILGFFLNPLVIADRAFCRQYDS
jgi:hypothetical protein